MDFLEDNFSEELDEKIKQINGLKNKGDNLETLETRICQLIYCMGRVDIVANEFFKFKENNLVFDTSSAIKYDYKMCDYAERFYTQSLMIVSFMKINQENPAIKLISPTIKTKFYKLMERMMHLAARWHIERIINTYEFDSEAGRKAFPSRKPVLGECIFYADRMNATKMGIEFDDGIMPKLIIFAVQPNAGKSFVANVYSLMSTCLHRIYFKTSGILRMSNNTSNAMGFSNQIKSMIEDERICLIYPELSKYFADPSKPTILEKSTAEEWKLAGLDPRIRASYFARGRDTAINSIRVFVALIIDDLSDGFDQMNNDEAHQGMTTKFYVDMQPRRDNEDIPILIIGTMFNEFDIQNTIINKLETSSGLIQSEIHRNTRHTPNYEAVVVTVDCFDEKGNSIAPKLISTNQLVETQNSLKAYEFDLVYRQIRSSREPRCFDYGLLKTYKNLPQTLSDGSIAVLDPTRKNGADYFSLPCFKKDSETGLSYFVDCIYEQKSLGKLADPKNTFLMKVIKFLINNNVRELTIENNTSNTIGMIFDEKFKLLGYSCKINEIYTTKEKGSKNKTERILDQEATIVSNIVFPEQGLFPPLDRRTLFMTDFTHYDSKLQANTKKQHDDAPDSVRIYAQRHLYNTSNRFSKVSSFQKNLIWR
jgi:hypothetical protein